MAVNSREKGKVGERQWAAFCREQGYADCRRTEQYCGNTGGESADVVGLDGIHQEVKRVEHLNIHEAMAQAVRDSEGSGKLPIVAHRKNRTDWLVTMRAKDWFQIYSLWRGGKVK